MFVSDEDPMEGFGRSTHREQTLTDLARAQSSIDQEPRGLGLEIRTVTTRTTGKNRETHRHGITLGSRGLDMQWRTEQAIDRTSPTAELTGHGENGKQQSEGEKTDAHSNQT